VHSTTKWKEPEGKERHDNYCTNRVTALQAAFRPRQQVDGTRAKAGRARSAPRTTARHPLTGSRPAGVHPVHPPASERDPERWWWRRAKRSAWTLPLPGIARRGSAAEADPNEGGLRRAAPRGGTPRSSGRSKREERRGGRSRGASDGGRD